MSIYIHIPFCSKICSYCDFPKVVKNDKWIDEYLIELEKEIKIKYQGEIINTIYIGGGTPSTLSIEQLKKLFKIIKIFKINKNAEISFEANSEDLTEEKLKLLKQNINRLSIGIETFDKNILKQLNRTVNRKNIKMAFKYFKNINIDLMYGFKNQTINNLKKDLEEVIKLNPSHISTYSLIIEPNTKFYIEKYKNIDENTDRNMYDLIVKTLKSHNYKHYEISNFSKENSESKHNLVYWNNEKYYGFGLGAGGYLKNIRYQNTRNLTKYLKGNHIEEERKLDINETIQNEFILGLRKIDGINKKRFKEKYNINIDNLLIIKNLKKDKLLEEKDNNIFINKKYIYISNEILIKFIDFTLPEH